MFAHTSADSGEGLQDEPLVLEATGGCFQYVEEDFLKENLRIVIIELDKKEEDL